LAAATNYPALASIQVNGNITSSASILKIVECCPDIESLAIDDRSQLLELSVSDVRALASLPRLHFGCIVDNDGVAALTRCSRLKRLAISWSAGLATVLEVIGQSLTGLDVWGPSVEAINVIIELCPNLTYLEFSGWDVDKETRILAIDSVKKGLKRQSRFTVNGRKISLGTKWKGYAPL
jgi:hypothetical protein